MKLSIIIPTREEESVIGEAINQFKKNLLFSHEVIVSDGGSADKTVERARIVADKVIIFSGNKHAAGIGRNDGAKIATGDYLAFLDADVRLNDPQSFFNKAFRHFEEDKNIVGITVRQRAFPNIETVGDKISFFILNTMIRFQNNVLNKGETSGKFMLVRRHAFDKINGFREDIVTREDGDFFYRLSKIGKTRYDKSLVVYHGARRAHKVGWIKLWTIWTLNMIYFGLFNKSYSKDWRPVR